MKKLLHIGCGVYRHKGFINTDKDEMDIRQPWPHESGSVDGIVSMCVFQCLTWNDLVYVTFREAHRVLKTGGVMRMGVVLEETNYRLDKVLYGANINLFSYDLLKSVLLNRIGFSSVKLCKHRQSAIPEFAIVDNRHHKGTSYVEVIK